MDKTRIEVLKEIISKVLPHVLKDSDVEADDSGFSCKDRAVPPASDDNEDIFKDLEDCEDEEDSEAPPEMPIKKREPRIVEISVAAIQQKKPNKQSEVQEILGKKPRK
jgi:hypothetical protein